MHAHFIICFQNIDLGAFDYWVCWFHDVEECDIFHITWFTDYHTSKRERLITRCVYTRPWRVCMIHKSARYIELLYIERGTFDYWVLISWYWRVFMIHWFEREILITGCVGSMMLKREHDIFWLLYFEKEVFDYYGCWFHDGEVYTVYTEWRFKRGMMGSCLQWLCVVAMNKRGMLIVTVTN